MLTGNTDYPGALWFGIASIIYHNTREHCQISHLITTTVVGVVIFIIFVLHVYKSWDLNCFALFGVFAPI